jgi:K+-transporting ATPase ATPase C chain
VKTLVRPAVLLLAVLSVLTGVVYPLVLTGVAQLIFPRQARGSLVEASGRRAGSALVGQPFSDPRYFWSRPSATSLFPYNATSSGGSNLDLNNPALTAAVKARIEVLRAADPGNRSPVPVDLVTGSGSALDPHISPAGAEFQISRVARARGLTDEAVRRIVAEHTEGRTFGLLGEPRVNVFELNLALDTLAGRPGGAP